MSEFKKNLAIASASAIVAIGGFVAASEVSANYGDAKQDCIERFETEKDVASCQENVGRDESGALETLAYLGLIGAVIGGCRLLGGEDEFDF